MENENKKPNTEQRTDSSNTRPAQAVARPATAVARPPFRGQKRPLQNRGPRPERKDGAPRPTDDKRPRSGGKRHGSHSQHRKQPVLKDGFRITSNNRTEPKIPDIGENIRIIPLGGVEEIGRNMTVIEYKNDIIVIDAGFQFKEDDTPGIDYILPNTKYLEERKDKIRGLIITHGHLDHIGGLPYIIDRIGNPKIYTRNLTSIMIQKRQTEFPHIPPLDIHVVEDNNTLMLGDMPVRFFGVTHTIPDSMGIIIETPYGPIVTPGDFKLEHEETIATEREEEQYKVFNTEKVLLMLADSTNVENPGFSTPESVVHKNLDEIIKNTQGRLIIGTFASQLERLMNIIRSAEDYGKKIVLEGRSMKVNIEIAQIAKLLDVKKDTIISSQEAANLPPGKVVVLATGAQGEEFAALMRMANKTHKFVQMNKFDTVLLSSSVVPGNEKTVQKLKDAIARQGAKVIHYRTSDVYIHSTGHGNRGELEWLHKKIKPKFFVPVHGHHYHLKIHKDLAMSLGMPEENIVVPDDCSIIEIREQGTKMVLLKEKAGVGYMMVDGFSVGDVQEVVIRDRQMLAQDGMFVVIAIIDSKTGRLLKSPDIISRGFVYLKESQELLRQTRIIIKRAIESETGGMRPVNLDYVKDAITDDIGKYLLQKTAKRPLVIPVISSI